MKNKTIYEIHQDFLAKKYTVYELVQEKINLIKKSCENDDNVYLATTFDSALSQAKQLDKLNLDITNNYLFGIPYTLKDNVSTNSLTTTAGSLFLKNYQPSFNATVFNKLAMTPSVLLAKVNMDEFGWGGTGLCSGYGHIKNPINPLYITAGSSSGSAVSVYEGVSAFSIGTDTGDSVRAPATLLGIVGFKPSYGVVSRYGVIPYASSLDHVGLMTNDVRDAAIVMDAIAGFDLLDSTTINRTYNFYKKLNDHNKPKLLVFDDIFEMVSPSLKPYFEKFIKLLEKSYVVEHANFGRELINMISPVYKVIANTEGISNLANMSGIIFGNHEDIDAHNYVDKMKKMRGKYFGLELKKRAIAGAYYSNCDHFESIYLKATMIRNIIVNKINEHLKEYDAYIIPGSVDIAHKIDDLLNYQATSKHGDAFLQIANFGGLPSISIPLGLYDNLPYGININAKQYDDEKLVSIAYELEKFINNHKNQF